MQKILKHKYALLSYVIISTFTGLLLRYQHVDTLTLIKTLEYWVVVFTFTFASGLLLYLTNTRAKRVNNIVESLVTIVSSIVFLYVVNSFDLDNQIVDITLIYICITIYHIVGVRLVNALHA